MSINPSDLPDLVDSESNDEYDDDDDDDDEIPTSHTAIGKGMRKDHLESSPVILFMSPRIGSFQEGDDLNFDSGATEDVTIRKSKERKPTGAICYDLMGGMKYIKNERADCATDESTGHPSWAWCRDKEEEILKAIRPAFNGITLPDETAKYASFIEGGMDHCTDKMTMSYYANIYMENASLPFNDVWTRWTILSPFDMAFPDHDIMPGTLRKMISIPSSAMKMG